MHKPAVCSGQSSPKKTNPLPHFFDSAFEWFYRYAASGGVPASWFGPDYSTLPGKASARDPLHLEIVSHCWNYANILTYQLSSLVLFPPKETVVCMTVYYEPGDKRTRKVLDYFEKQQVENVHWNFCPLQKEYLLRRAIGRNLAARNTNADWIFFTDCDVLFREQSIDLLSQQLKEQPNLLVYPRFHMVSELLPNDDELFTDFTQAGMIRDIDPGRFYREERTRAVGGFQIARGDAARLGGYCGDIAYYHRPVKRWRKCYEDRTFRWLLGTQGTAVEVPGFYRIRHAAKGRKGKAVGGQ